MKTLNLNLKGEYFTQIKSGDKIEEYRLCKPYWQKRLENRHYDKIRILCGYPNKDDKEKCITIPWQGYTIKTITHPHFGNKPVKVYAINVTQGDKIMQQSMFINGQDLPLFSQTPPKAKAQLFKPAAKPVQASLFNVKCGLCLDTGLVTKAMKVCICQK